MWHAHKCVTPITAKLRVKIHHTGKFEFLRSLWGHLPSYYIDSNIHFCINSGWAACNNYIERKIKKCVKFRTWKSLLAIILSYCTGFIYCKLGHTFLSFSSCYCCTFDNFYYCWLFRDHFKRSLQHLWSIKWQIPPKRRFCLLWKYDPFILQPVRCIYLCV